MINGAAHDFAEDIISADITRSNTISNRKCRCSGVVRDNAEINQNIAAQTALGRVGLPDDIGGAVAALLSEENGWVNGQRIEVSGGVFL